ncbi:hypothetical protein IQ268_24140 [Oculatella sp. LEGE 06141]|nr:hypothetical protein [Oculatella sp. LEGE 06141]MBE9181659.1 hypothetical protein [Oculatella sp. LEGE 06141]
MVIAFYVPRAIVLVASGCQSARLESANRGVLVPGSLLTDYLARLP